MHPRRRFALLVLIFLILLPIGIYLYIQNKWIVEPLSLGSKIPSAIITTLDGTYVNIDSLITQKTIIVFFSTTCPHCKSELKILDSLHQLFKNKFEIIALSLSPKSETKQFLSERKIPFATYIDNKNEAKIQFRVIPIPAMFFIDKQKRLVKYQAGEYRSELLYSALLKYVSLPNDSLIALL